MAHNPLAQDQLHLAVENKLRKSGRATLPKTPIPLFPTSLTRQYLKGILEFIDGYKEIVRTVLIPDIPRLIRVASTLEPQGSRQDAFSDDLQAATKRVNRLYGNKFSDLQISQLAALFAERTQKFNLGQITNGIEEVLGVNPFIVEPYLNDKAKDFVRQNVGLIKDITDKAQQEIEGIIFRGASTGIRHETVAKEIIERFPKWENRAKLIARDQISKFNSQLTRLRQTEVGVKKYRWKTAGDSLVRDSHLANSGEIFEWANPPVGTGHPGEDINCRCVAIPIFKD